MPVRVAPAADISGIRSALGLDPARTRIFRVGDYLPAGHVHGSDDAGPSIQACVDAAASYGRAVVVLDARDYRVATRFVLPRNVSLAGPGAFVCRILLDDVVNDPILVGASGLFDINVTLTSNVSRDSRKVTVPVAGGTAAAQGFTPGRHVYLTNNKVGTADAHGPYTSRILSTSGQVVFLEGTPAQDYLVADAAKLYASTAGLWPEAFIEGVGFLVRGRAYGTLAANREVALWVWACENFQVRDCWFDGFRQAGPLIWGGSRQCSVERCLISNINGSTLAGTPVSVDGATSIRVVDSTFEYSAGGCSFVRAPYSVFSGNKVNGTVRQQGVAGESAPTDWASRGVKVVWGSHRTLVSDNHFSDIVLDAVHGADSSYCDVLNNVCWRVGEDSIAQAGMVFGAGTSVMEGWRISGNRIHRCPVAAFFVDARFSQCNDNYAENVCYLRPGDWAITIGQPDVQCNNNTLREYGAGTYGICLAPIAKRAVICGNKLTNTLAPANAIRTVDAAPATATDGAIVVGNHCDGDIVSTHANDYVAGNK